MDYSPIHNQFTVSQKDLQSFSLEIKYAMKDIRKALGYPVGKRKRDVGLEPIDHIERGILSACKHIGVNFGVEWGDKLDLSDCEE